VSTSAYRRATLLLAAASVCLAAVPSMADEIPITPGQLEDILPALDTAQRQQLLTTGELSRAFTQGDNLALVPTQDMRAEMEAGLESIEFTVGVEVLFLIAEPYSAYSTEELAGKLLEMSTLAGTEYYSESRGKMRTLFADSYTIDNGQDRNRIPDTAIDEVPASGTAHVYQQDTTFGWNPNTIAYDVGTSTIHMLTTNDATFSWGFIPIIRPGRLHSHLLILRTEDFMIYYANFGAHALRVSLFEKRIHDSFYNRLVALQNWFEAKLVE
jgi:uncharacterized protein DUF6675